MQLQVQLAQIELSKLELTQASNGPMANTATLDIVSVLESRSKVTLPKFDGNGELERNLG